MKFKNKIIIFSCFTLNAMMILPIVSCGEDFNDYKVMSWSIDNSKVEQLKNDITTFNNEPISKEKLLKIIKFKITTPPSFELDKYTLEALNNNWFKTIQFNEDKQLIIELLDKNSKNKSCPYRLPNHSLVMKS